MMKFNQDIIEVCNSQLAYVATTNPDGTINLGPKRTCRLYGDDKLIWNENTGKHIFESLKTNPNVTIAFVNWGRNKGYRFIGIARIVTEGKEYEDCVAYAQANGAKAPKAAVVIDIKEVINLAPSKAGEKVSL